MPSDNSPLDIGRDIGRNEARESADSTAARDTGRKEARDAKEKAKGIADEASHTAKETKDSFLKTLEDDGVVNPKGLAMAGFGFLFLAAVPVTSWIAQPNGLLEKAVNGVCSSVTYLGSAGATSRVAQTGKIAALSTLYIAFTYAFSGAGSAAGVDSGNKHGRDNNHPRAQVHHLRGLPLRLYSAHYNLLEMFGGFGLSAALAQTIAPADQTIINLLGLHVITKVFLYYPSYILNVGLVRTITHVVATASVINVALRLSKRPLL